MISPPTAPPSMRAARRGTNHFSVDCDMVAHLFDQCEEDGQFAVDMACIARIILMDSAMSLI